jgi:hypothetical protein
MAYNGSFETETTGRNGGIFLNAGLFPIKTLYESMGLVDVVNANLGVRKSKGCPDSDHVLAQILMQIGGGSALEHLSYFGETFPAEQIGLNIPSPTAARDFMNKFDNEQEDAKRGYGISFVPEENEHLRGFAVVHNQIFQQAYRMKPVQCITLDQDATFIPTEAKEALFSYKKERAYEALNIYCPQYDIIVATQFRDGNVTPGFGQLEQLKEVISNIPAGVKSVCFRSDTAGYQSKLLTYCAKRDESRRFPIINFTVSCPVCEEFKQAARKVPECDWKRIYRKTKDGQTEETKLECAEVVYVPTSLCTSKKDPEYRFIATREVFRATGKKSIETARDAMQKELELEIMVFSSNSYPVSVLS